MKAGDASARTIDGGTHAVWLPSDDGNGEFAHSIGLYYLYNLPEILLVSPTPATIGATSRALAMTVNAIAAAMADGTRIKPGDRYAVVAETSRAPWTSDVHAGSREPGRIAIRVAGAAPGRAHAGRGVVVLRELHGRAHVPGARVPAAAVARPDRGRGGGGGCGAGRGGGGASGGEREPVAPAKTKPAPDASKRKKRRKKGR